MLLDYQRGYSVRTRKDLKLISFESESLEDCKRFCLDDSVIVEVYPVKCGFNLRVWKSTYNSGFNYDKYSKRLDLWKLHVQVIPEYTHKNGKIVFDPLKDK
jgi:hypothetical protein